MCWISRERKMHTKLWRGNVLVSANLENHEGDGNNSIKRILEKQVVRAGDEWNWL
jgi:hypothetical protein